MIISLFLPERIGSYFLLSKRIVAIEITKHTLYATVMQLKGTTRTLEALFQERITDDPESTYDEQIISALRTLKVKLGKYDEVYCSLPSSQVIFKEITFPFIGLKKIKLVVPFEIESQLPFNLDEGVVDAIVTGINTEEQQTDILVGAMKNDIVARYAGYFEEAELPLDKVSVDIFELYSLFHQSLKDQEVTALIEMGLSETTLGLTINGRLKYVRSFTDGIRPLEGELILDAATKEHITSLFDQIRLTLDTALQKFAPGESLTKIIITGAVTDIQDQPGIIKLAKSAMECPVDLIDPKQLSNAQVFSNKIATITCSFISSIALALSTDKTEDFTLLKAQAHAKENQRIGYQLFTIAALTLTMFLSFSVYSFFRIRTLKKAYISAEQEAVRELKKQFKLRSHQTRRLDLANKAAQAELRKLETAWRRISPANRYSYLKYLAELTKCINMKESQLQLDSLILKDDTIKLYGKVPGYQQLTKLQNQLECSLFNKVPKLQAFNFKSEPITLTVTPEAL